MKVRIFHRGERLVCSCGSSFEEQLFDIGTCEKNPLQRCAKGKEDYAIIAFDLTQRTLTEIPLFDHCTVQKYALYSLRIMGGCLSVSCSVRHHEMTEIWVMKDYKVW
ncbi:hypothetical protein JHK87_022319 [Glycine soja]|nr:hypothetical protein JHK87_022319 [Glycine soja]